MASGEQTRTGGRGHVAVDRLEGNVAVVIDDAGRAYDVPAGELPLPIVEGMVLSVANGPNGTPDWSTAVVDDVERNRRVANLDARLEDLAKGDKGGDVAL